MLTDRVLVVNTECIPASRTRIAHLTRAMTALVQQSGGLLGMGLRIVRGGVLGLKSLDVRAAIPGSPPS